MEKIFGEQIFNKIAFSTKPEQIAKILNKNIGENATNLFFLVNKIITLESYDKYLKYLDNYSDYDGMVKKRQDYKK